MSAVDVSKDFPLLAFSFHCGSWTFGFYGNTLSPQMPGVQHFETRRVNISHNLQKCCLLPRVLFFESQVCFVSLSRQLGSSLITLGPIMENPCVKCMLSQPLVTIVF